METTSKDYGYAVHSVHAKGYGLLRGEMRVLDDLPPVPAQGVFAEPGTYPAALRLCVAEGLLGRFAPHRGGDGAARPRGLRHRRRTADPHPRRDLLQSGLLLYPLHLHGGAHSVEKLETGYAADDAEQ